MSFADEEELSAFIGRDHWLPKVTAKTVAEALKIFVTVTPLVPSKDMDWLAMAVRRALACSMHSLSDTPEWTSLNPTEREERRKKGKGSITEGPDRTSTAYIRAELERLAALAGSTWLELFQCDEAAESRLWDHAWHHWDGEGGADLGDGKVMGEPSDYRRFKAAVAELDWLTSFMRDAAKATPGQRGPWRLSEEKRVRVERGQYLAPVFEAAFGQRVSANNWPSGTHRGPSAFMDFYQRMVALAFNEQATPDISGVLKAACLLHRQHPAQFAEGVIPGL